MTEKELAWVTAIFDAEGNINRPIKMYTKRNGKTTQYDYPKVMIGHTSHDLLERFHNLVGLGKLKGPYVKKHGKYMYLKKGGDVSIYDYTGRVFWVWYALNDNAIKFLALIWNEWLSQDKRDKAIALEMSPPDGTSESDLEAYINARIKASIK